MKTNAKENSAGNAQEKPPRTLEEINERHIRNIDKYFRSREGAASNLTGFHAGFIYLDIRVDDRLRVPIEAITRNIANSWRRERELNGAVAYCASIYKSARWSGYLLGPDATSHQKEEAIRRMKEPANPPDVFIKMIEEQYGFADSLQAIYIL